MEKCCYKKVIPIAYGMQLAKHISTLRKPNMWEIAVYGFDNGLGPHEPQAKLWPSSSKMIKMMPENGGGNENDPKSQ